MSLIITWLLIFYALVSGGCGDQNHKRLSFSRNTAGFSYNSVMDKPQLEALNHVAIEVRSLDVALHFYRDIIGLSELNTPPAAVEKGIRWLALPEGRMLHLVENSQTQPTRSAHFAFTVPNVQAWREYMKHHGVEEVPPRIALYDAVDRMYMRDPSGNMLEFVRWR